MFSFVQNWFAPRANPIGVDFGSDALRMAQVQWVGDEHRLIAAASADVPSRVRHDPAARMAFFSETARDLLAQGKFHGRQAVLALPAASMFIQHLRLPKMDDETLKKSLPWEARGKLPIDPSHALLRHLVAGEVYQDQEPKNEVVLMAAGRELVNQLLAAAARARLDVIGMNVEPKALVDCFSHIYRRKNDAEVTNCFVDIGCGASRAVIARGSHILFARVIPIGGDHFCRAVAGAMKISFEEAKTLRIKLCHSAPALDEHREKQMVRQEAEETIDQAFPLLGAGLRAADGATTSGPVAVMEAPAPSAARLAEVDNDPQQQIKIVEQACREPLNKMVEELDLCRRYYEATFPSKPVERLIFVGGEARHRGLCQHVARELALAAQVGDPLVRMGRISDVGIESGIDRRQPQPSWAVAIGLSMGPAAGKPQE